MGEVTLYGASYSTFVRSARLALEEKGVPYQLVEVDIFAEGGPPAEHLARHPFGKIPAFQHGDFRLFETAAILHYVDEAFDGPPLVPAEAKGRARVNQIVGLLGSYAYPSMVWKVCAERIFASLEGREPDESEVATGMRTAETCMTVLEDLLGESPYLVGPDLSLADLHAYPIFAYFSLTPEGAEALERHAGLGAWFARMTGRASAMSTRTPMELGKE